MRLYNPKEIVCGVIGEFNNGVIDDLRIDDWFEVANVAIEQLRIASNSDLSFPAEFASSRLSMLADIIETGHIDYSDYFCSRAEKEADHE